MTINDTATKDTDSESLDLSSPSVPVAFRETLARKDARITELEGKAAEAAFKDAGFPDKNSKERKALEKFYDGDRTDPVAIRRFAEDELGYNPAAPQPVAHVQPAPTVVADARADQLDAAQIPVDMSRDETELAKRRDALLAESIKPGVDNAAAVEAAMAAELVRAGVTPLTK